MNQKRFSIPFRSSSLTINLTRLRSIADDGFIEVIYKSKCLMGYVLYSKAEEPSSYGLSKININLVIGDRNLSLSKRKRLSMSIFSLS